jgi:hypothetical protein
MLIDPEMQRGGAWAPPRLAMALPSTPRRSRSGWARCRLGYPGTPVAPGAPLVLVPMVIFTLRVGLG